MIKTAKVKGIIKPDDSTNVAASLDFEYEEDEPATFTIQMEYAQADGGGWIMRPTSVSKNI